MTFFACGDLILKPTNDAEVKYDWVICRHYVGVAILQYYENVEARQMEEKITTNKHGNKQKSVVRRGSSHEQSRIKNTSESEKLNGKLSRASSHSSLKPKTPSRNSKLSNGYEERRRASYTSTELRNDLTLGAVTYYSKHGEAFQDADPRLPSVGRVSRTEQVNNEHGQGEWRYGVKHSHNPATFQRLHSTESAGYQNGNRTDKTSEKLESSMDSTLINFQRNEIRLYNEKTRSKTKLHRSHSTDLSLLQNKKRRSKQMRQSYAPLSHDFSPSAEFKEFADRNVHRLSHRRSHSDLHSLRKLSKHQKYFYSEDTDMEVSLPLQDSSDHTNEDHNFHSIRDSQDVRVDVDVLLAGQQSEDDGYSFPALEGYRRHGLKHSFPSAPFKRLKFYRGNFCLVVLSTMVVAFSGFLIFCPFVSLMCFLFPLCYFLKKSFSCCCCYRNGCELGQLLSRQERLLYDDINNTNIYHGLLFIEYGLDLHRIRDLINARIICAEDKLKIKLYPKFTRKIAQTCSGMAWIPDHSFLINNHVYSMPRSVETFEDLQEYVSEYSSKPLSVQSPLWEIQILKNFGDQRETVLFVRVHPIVADGVTLVQSIYASLTDMDSVACSVPKFSHQGRFLNTLKAIFLGPLIYLKYVLTRSDFNMLHGKHIHRSGHYVVSWSEPFSLEKLNRIKQVTRSTINDVFLSVASGSLRTYLQVNGIEHPYDMKALIPVHYIGGWEENRVERNNHLFISVPIPTNTEGVIPRLWRVKAIMDNVSHMALFSVTQGALWLTSVLLPDKLFTKLWKSTHGKSSCIISNVPGPETSLKYGSREVKAMICWMPPKKDIAISITFVTYGEEVRMSVITDRSVLPNPEMLTKDFIYQMSSLCELLANRRIPNEIISKKAEPVEVDCEIRAEQTIEQIQRRMCLIQQEIHDMKVQLDLEKHGKETKIMRKIDMLKEQFRELLVEMRQRKAAEAESAVILSSDDDLDDEIDDDGEPRRPFRRRTLSISSRLSTVSQSSTVRPLAAAPSSAYEASETDSLSEASFRMDGISQVGRAAQYRRQYSEQPRQYRRENPATYQRQYSEQPKKFEILDYASSPSMERRYRTY